MSMQLKSSDHLMEKMVKFKYDDISQMELNEFYDEVKLLIWRAIHECYCPMNKLDMQHDLWCHITKVKHKWDEKRSNNVSTWLYRVISNRIKEMQKYTSRRNFIIPENVMKQDDDARSNILEMLDGNKCELFDEYADKYCNKLFDNVMEDLDEDEKKYVRLMVDGKYNQELIQKYSRGKNKVKKLPQWIVAKVMGWRRGKTNCFKRKLKEKIIKKLEITDVF